MRLRGGPSAWVSGIWSSKNCMFLSELFANINNYAFCEHVFNDEVGITIYELNPYEGVTRPSKVENYEKGIYLLLLKCTHIRDNISVSRSVCIPISY
ncbi:hypothetical protein PFMG_03793 [Plasmodium falciparum IGH-CR14]|uniref:Uncharacterized protein n=1 Tax=Plasmodium falciparum IGH-CR14 TaxID=580059 RepID=A0A0L1ID52_PLAFA|nr:hypothetical protein PFMG_03793 [Plasmodium falciparum IGH-CR14]